jgi:REP element-mobilizing transposase RayT
MSTRTFPVLIRTKGFGLNDEHQDVPDTHSRVDYRLEKTHLRMSTGNVLILILKERMMATRYRQRCESNVYHVTARGTAKQIIFEDDVDRRFFGQKMRKCLDDCGVELFAWCLMSNHVHLLVRSELDSVTKFMQKLLTGYVRHFNERHDRTGHLFQNRFDSVPVQTDEQLMTAVRYIHRNPDDMPNQRYDRYEWSSYREYVGRPFVSHVEFVLDVFGGLDRFVAFHRREDGECGGDDAIAPKHASAKIKIPDEEAVEYAKSLLGMDSLASLASCGKTSRDSCLAVLKEARLPIAQISRITGIGRNIIQRAK